MAITYKQEASSTTATNPSVAITPTAGSLLVAFCCTLAISAIDPSGLSIGDTQGNVWKECDFGYSNVSLDFALRIYYALNVAGAATTITYTTNRNGAIFHVTEYAGPTAFVGQWVRDRARNNVAISSPATEPITVPGNGLFVGGFITNGSGIVVTSPGFVAQPQVASSAILAPTYKITRQIAQAASWFISASSDGPCNYAAFMEGTPSFVQQKQLGGRGASW